MTAHRARVHRQRRGWSASCGCGWWQWTSDAQDADMEAAAHILHETDLPAERHRDDGGVYWQAEVDA